MIGDFVKILYTYNGINGEHSELLETITVKENCFRILQIPTEALGISKGDEVEALIISDENTPEFITFTKKSGNCTIKLISFINDTNKARVLNTLEKEKCDTVSHKDSFLVNLPPSVDLDDIQQYLEKEQVSFQIMNPNPYEGNLYIPF